MSPQVTKKSDSLSAHVANFIASTRIPGHPGRGRGAREEIHPGRPGAGSGGLGGEERGTGPAPPPGAGLCRRDDKHHRYVPAHARTLRRLRQRDRNPRGRLRRHPARRGKGPGVRSADAPHRAGFAGGSGGGGAGRPVGARSARGLQRGRGGGMQDCRGDPPSALPRWVPLDGNLRDLRGDGRRWPTCAVCPPTSPASRWESPGACPPDSGRTSGR